MGGGNDLVRCHGCFDFPKGQLKVALLLVGTFAPRGAEFGREQRPLVGELVDAAIRLGYLVAVLRRPLPAEVERSLGLRQLCSRGDDPLAGGGAHGVCLHRVLFRVVGSAPVPGFALPGGGVGVGS